MTQIYEHYLITKANSNHTILNVACSEILMRNSYDI